VKNHYGRTYFDEFMPTCLRGAVFLDTVYIAIEKHAVHEVFAHELRQYNEEGEAVATGTEIITSVFGWWKELM